MNTIVLGLEEITLLCLIAIFFILVMTIYKVIQEVSFFNSKSAMAVVSACVALLSIIGMVRLFTPGDGINVASGDSVNSNNDGLEFLLLPYVALGITIILALLLKFIFGVSEKYGSRKFSKEYPHDIEKKNSSERSAFVRKNTDEKSRIRK